MTGTRLRFEAEYDLPREIVWDALVDSDLVSGWLAEADIEPRIDGRYDLEWRHFDVVRATTGQIVELIEPEMLVVDTDNFGVATLRLEELPRGSRGRSTRLSVDVEAIVDQHFSAMVAVTWRISLEQLAELLRGHPVDWARWRTERIGRWHELLESEHRRI
jgi:uncharacterized protein YndB with AHSA1/START domain